MPDKLSLKWGSLKGWKIESDAAIAAFEKYAASGKHCVSAMAQRDTPEMKAALCELIDAVDCEMIYLDWYGEDVTKEEAKKYVMEYGS